jgi:hypothetical protein
MEDTVKKWWNDNKIIDSLIDKIIKDDKITRKEKTELVKIVKEGIIISDLIDKFDYDKFKNYLKTYDICRNINEKVVIDSLGHHSNNLDTIIKRIFSNYLKDLAIKGLNDGFINKFKFQDEKLIYSKYPGVFIRYYDDTIEKVSKKFYKIDFSGKKQCSDQDYQGLNYQNCAVVGFFKLDKMGISFLQLYKKFGCKPNRKVLLFDKEDFLLEEEEDYEFRKINPFIIEKGDLKTEQVNPGEYVFRGLNNKNKFKIPFEKSYDSLNDLILDLYGNDIFDYYVVMLSVLEGDFIKPFHRIVDTYL